MSVDSEIREPKSKFNLHRSLRWSKAAVFTTALALTMALTAACGPNAKANRGVQNPDILVAPPAATAPVPKPPDVINAAAFCTKELYPSPELPENYRQQLVNIAVTTAKRNILYNTSCYEGYKEEYNASLGKPQLIEHSRLVFRGRDQRQGDIFQILMTHIQGRQSDVTISYLPKEASDPAFAIQKDKLWDYAVTKIEFPEDTAFYPHGSQNGLVAESASTNQLFFIDKTGQILIFKTNPV